MTAARRSLGRTLVVAGALLAVDVGGARLLDTLDAADRLLAGGAGAIALLPVLGLFLAARLALYFVVPGLVLRAVMLALPGRPRSGGR